MSGLLAEQYEQAEKELKELRRKIKNIDRVHAKAHDELVKSSNALRTKSEEALRIKSQKNEVFKIFNFLIN